MIGMTVANSSSLIPWFSPDYNDTRNETAIRPAATAS